MEQQDKSKWMGVGKLPSLRSVQNFILTHQNAYQAFRPPSFLASVSILFGFLISVPPLTLL